MQRYLGFQRVALTLLPVLALSILTTLSVAASAQTTTDEEGGGSELEKLSGVPVHGFANMGWGNDSSTDNHRRFTRGFYLNNLDLYYSPDLGTHVRFLSEVVFEPDSESQQPSFDAERMQAGYTFSPNLTLWVGRFHTPIGYYNTAYHHGMELQTAVDRPRFIDFEDHYGVLPMHTNGLWLNSTFVLGEQRMSIMGWIGSSDRIVTTGSNFSSLDFSMTHNDNNHLAVGTRWNWNGGGTLEGMQAGFTLLTETIDTMGQGAPVYGPTGGVNDMTPNPNTGDNFTSRFFLYGAHFIYDAHGFEFLNEAYGFHNTTISADNQPSFNSYAGYSQLAYWINGVSAPYVRYERGAFNTGDPFFFGQYNGLPYTKEAAGYRYSLNDNAAVKIEVSNISFGASSPTNIGQSFKDVHADYSVRF